MLCYDTDSSFGGKKDEKSIPLICRGFLLELVEEEDQRGNQPTHVHIEKQP